MFVTVDEGKALVRCCLLTEEIDTENSEKAQWFGMSVAVDDKVIRVYHSLSDRRELIEELIAAINSGNVSLNHLELILDDWFGSL